MEFNPERFHNKRVELRFSQRELSKAAGLEVSTVANIESGRTRCPKYSVMVALAAALNEQPDYFFDPAVVNKQQAV